MLPGCFDYIFVHLKTKNTSQTRIKPEILSTLGPNPAQTQTRSEKPRPTYNSGSKTILQLLYEGRRLKLPFFQPFIDFLLKETPQTR